MPSVHERLSEPLKQRLQAGFARTHDRAMTDDDWTTMTVDQAREYLRAPEPAIKPETAIEVPAHETKTKPRRKLKKRHLAGAFIVGAILLGAFGEDTQPTPPTAELTTKSATTASSSKPAESTQTKPADTKPSVTKPSSTATAPSTASQSTTPGRAVPAPASNAAPSPAPSTRPAPAPSYSYTPSPAPAVAATPAPAPSNCHPNYSPCVPNVSYDLNCLDIQKQVRVIGADPFGLDRDSDGYGCESYR